MRRVIMLAIASLVLTLVGCSHQPAPIVLVEGINGIVLDSQGLPVEGAVVVFYRADVTITESMVATQAALATQTLAYQTVTDQAGAYHYEEAPPGTYNIYITKDRLAALVPNVVVESGLKVQASDVKVKHPGAIAGTVTLSDGANPEGVAVFVPGTGFMAFCDADGHFEILGVPELPEGSTYRVVAMFSGYSNAAGEIGVTKDEISTIDLELHLQAGAQPAITGVSPDPVVPGGVLTISGRNFGAFRGTSFVTFRGHALQDDLYESWSSDAIEVSTPGSAHCGEATVLIAIGSYEASAEVTVMPEGGPPQITSVSPNTVRPGDVLTINGSGFGSTVGGVSIGGYAAGLLDFTAWTETTIQVRVPVGVSAGSAHVVVSTDTCSATASVTIGTNHPPTITLFTYAPQPAFTNELTTFTWAIEDADGDPVSCVIDWNDLTPSDTIADCIHTTEQVHMYAMEGPHTATITADDSYGGIAREYKTASVFFDYEGTWGYYYTPNDAPVETFGIDIPQEAAVEGSFGGHVSFANQDLSNGTLSATVTQAGITATIDVDYNYLLIDWHCTLTWAGLRTRNTVAGPVTTDSGFPCEDLEGLMSATKP